MPYPPPQMYLSRRGKGWTCGRPRNLWTDDSSALPRPPYPRGESEMAEHTPTPEQISPDVAHCLALLADGKAVLSRSEMWDLATVLSRLNEARAVSRDHHFDAL